MELSELSGLISQLRDRDITKKFENKIVCLERQFQAADGRTLEAFYSEYNSLSEEITHENELMKD